MDYLYNMKKSLPSYLYLILFSCVGFVYSSNVIDIVGIQWYYLSYVNLIFLAYVIFKRISNKTKNNAPLLFFKNPINLLYTLFFLFCLVSLGQSINYSVSVITISKLLISLTSLLIFHELEIFKNTDIKLISILMSLMLLFEVGFSLRGYFEIIKSTDFEFYMASEYLKGTTGNKNITSASIAFKLPFLYILFFLIKNKYLKGLLIVIASYAYFNLILLSSRAIIVSASICILFYISGSLISCLRTKTNYKIYLKRIGIYLTPIILATSFAYTSLKDDAIKIQNRVSTINTSDVSASTRLRYYEKGVDYFLSNPILGSGIGNWKLFSIKLDSDKIESYIVPYVAHNDYIELLTEIGLFGTIFYILFISSSFYFLLRVFFNTTDYQVQNLCLLLTLPFIFYFIDSNLNFPQYRPIMQVGLVIYLLLIYSFYKKTFINKWKESIQFWVLYFFI